MKSPYNYITLASVSPRRSELLEQLGVRFRVHAARVEEASSLSEAISSPEAFVCHNALLKAQWVAKRCPKALVLAADTTVCLGQQILNKPKDIEEAKSMLLMLSGCTHVVKTAFCLIAKELSIEHTECVKSSVTFKTLDNVQIERYFKLVNPLDKAGAYGIQEGRELIIDGYEGSFSNIMGLPLEALELCLKKHHLMEGLTA